MGWRWVHNLARRMVRRPVRKLTVASAGMLLTIGSGAGPARGPGRVREAWVDAKSVCLFRLGTSASAHMPATAAELAAALVDGWQRSIVFPDPDHVVTFDGGRFPAVNAMRIDLSHGELRPPRKKERIRVDDRIEGKLAVHRLEVRAEPLLLHGARLSMTLDATEARLAFERDRKGRPVMMLTEARSGDLQFAITQADLESLFLRTAREMAGAYGIEVDRTRLRFTQESPRSIGASLYLHTRFALVPAGMLFKAHVVVDDQMNARITGLTCDGDDVLGPIIVGLLRPTLARYDNETRPLLSFPAGHLRLRDVALTVDDSVHLHAAFGNR